MLKAKAISAMNKALGSCYYVDTLSYGFQHVLNWQNQKGTLKIVIISIVRKNHEVTK